MSGLGGNSMSEETDRSNNLQGADGADGADGVVATVVGGTNCSVDSTDAANPIVNADTQNNAKVTTKGDLEGFSTVAARIPVGTDGQVLEADSTDALGVKWKTPAAGSGSESLQALAPGTGFGMMGVAASHIGQLTVSSLSAGRATLDLIYFNGTTTVTDVSFWSVTAPTVGIDVHVALHTMVDKGNVGNQVFLEKITTVATADTTQNKSISTPWQPTKGWYWMVVWVPTTVTGVMFHNTNAHASYIGENISGYTMFSAAQDSVESGQYVLVDADYDTAPNTVITATDFNDRTGDYAFTGSEGNYFINSVVPLVVLKAG